MHALQLLPLAAIVLELLSRRWPRVLAAEVRRQLVWIAVGVYALALGILTWQALAGQSIVNPSGPVLVAGVAVAAAGFAATLATVLTAASLAASRSSTTGLGAGVA
jgi:hypothetical protein